MPALYLVALLPPEPVFSQIWALKQEVHARTGSRNAVRLPPHLTLLPPMRQPAEFEAACCRALGGFAATQRPFLVGVQDFAWFGDRTLFVRVSEAAAVRHLHVALLSWCATHLPAVPPETRPFTPHLTLATRDLPAAQVPALQQEFASRTFAATFAVTSITLFRHDGQQWVSRETFALGEPS
ncbi:2'-5' RNA ligase family protein [Hymenobacter algoricola]|uniref:2'-5' RNA ligase family protein n=1 Tax=Hymenobacter algoricola TaxID=486267 RepID=A0ABP7NKB6_9BACT